MKRRAVWVACFLLLVGLAMVLATTTVVTKEKERKVEHKHVHRINHYEEVGRAKKNSSVAISVMSMTSYFYDPFLTRWRSYAQAMGYDWYRIDLEKVKLRLPTAHWHKVFLIYELLDKGYEYVVFTDGDTILMQPTWTIEDFVHEGDSHTQLWISDDLAWAGTKINTGLMIVRQGTWSREMLKYAMQESKDKRIIPEHWPREQGSVHRWIRIHPKPWYKSYPYGVRFQIFSNFAGDPKLEAEKVRNDSIWVIHFAGGYSDERHEYALQFFRYMEDQYPIQGSNKNRME